MPLKSLQCAECVTCASECNNVRACIRVHLPFGLSLSDCQVVDWKKWKTVWAVSPHAAMSWCSFICVQDELLRHQKWLVIRIYAVSAMTKNPTTKTLMKVTMSKKTTMTTVQHRLLRLVWSYLPFSAVVPLPPPWQDCTTLYKPL